MTNLYIDFDGVIVDSIDVVENMIKEHGIKEGDADYFSFYRNVDWCDVLKKSKSINDSWDCIKRLICLGKFNVSILTHVNSIEEIEQKVKMVRKYLKDITIIAVPKNVSKSDMIKAEGAILVDDYVFNLDEWKKAGGIGVKFDLDMDGKGYPVIDRLDSLIDMFG